MLRLLIKRELGHPQQVPPLRVTLETCNFRDYLMLHTPWLTGCWVSELLNIKPSDLESHYQVVNITKAKGNSSREYY